VAYTTAAWYSRQGIAGGVGYTTAAWYCWQVWWGFGVHDRRVVYRPVEVFVMALVLMCWQQDGS
jgi:hypothetical protein